MVSPAHTAATSDQKTAPAQPPLTGDPRALFCNFSRTRPGRDSAGCSAG